MLSKTHPEATTQPEPKESAGDPLSAREVLADKRGVSTSISESLGSIGLGVAVMTLLAVSIGAAWNYGMDSSAKSTLDSVKSAQVLYKAKTGSYGDVSKLTTGQDAALSKSSDELKIAADDKNYCAAIESTSMFSPSYWVTAKSGELLSEKPTTEAAGIACPDPEAD